MREEWCCFGWVGREECDLATEERPLYCRFIYMINLLSWNPRLEHSWSKAFKQSVYNIDFSFAFCNKAINHNLLQFLLLLLLPALKGGVKINCNLFV